MRVATALLFLVACGDNAAPPISATPINGSRLRLVDEAWEGDLARIRPETLFDRDRDEECTPAMWSDGHHHCSPQTTTAIAYTDAECTRPIALWSTLSPFPAPNYFRQQLAESTSRVFSRGSRTNAPGEIYQLLSSGCQMQPTPADTDAYAVTTLTADDFPRVTVLPVEEDADQPLVRYAYGSEDGMQLLVLDAAYDARNVEDCAWTAETGENHSTCAPAAAELTYYSDDRCSTPLVDVTNGTPSGPFRYADPETTCRVYGTLGNNAELGQLYTRRSDGKCLLTVTSPVHFVRAIVPLKPAIASRKYVDEGHRLQRIERAELQPATETRLYDTLLGTECERTQLPDGDACVPISAPANPPPDATFSDDACTQQLSLSLLHDPVCGTPSPFTVTLGVNGVPRVFPLTPYTAPVYRSSTGDTCLLFIPDAAVYAFGAELPLSMLARVTDAPR